MNADEIGTSWQTGTDDITKHRRCMVVLSLVNIACMGAVMLYQTGTSHDLPDPPLGIFNSKKVTGSAEAYSLLSTPDGALGLNNYAITLMLIAMGGHDRMRDKPWLPLTAAGKAFFDLALSGLMLSREVFRQRSLCTLCLTVNISTAALAVLSLKEAQSALDALSPESTQ